MVPFSQHTYLWYAYDPSSGKVVYLARPSIRDGAELQLGDDPADVFVYQASEHGHASWVYDPVERRMHRPVFGRPFANTWHLAVLGTPGGVFAATNRRLYHAEVRREGGIAWELVDAGFPEPAQPAKYHYEFQPLVHDSRRDRLIQLKGTAGRVDVFVRPARRDGAWRQLETTGRAAIGREAVYIGRHDCVLWLGDRLHLLDLATRHMAELEVDLPDGLYGHECAMVYDPRHDLCVALVPARFSGPMQTFLFRYRPERSGGGG
jgi:hypothetical protein